MDKPRSRSHLRGYIPQQTSEARSYPSRPRTVRLWRISLPSYRRHGVYTPRTTESSPTSASCTPASVSMHLTPSKIYKTQSHLNTIIDTTTIIAFIPQRPYGGSRNNHTIHEFGHPSYSKLPSLNVLSTCHLTNLWTLKSHGAPTTASGLHKTVFVIPFPPIVRFQ